jgi:riboflavin kinase/FMN adenylyltransferase
MTIFQGLEGLRQLSAGSVLSIGNFDGIHRGHQRILEVAASLRPRSSSGRVAVVTFEPHPFTVLRPEHAPPRLTPPELKRELLAGAGVDDLVVLPPVPEVLNCSAEAFWLILRDEVRPAHMVEGDSFTFGRARGGDIARLREWSAGTSVCLHVIAPVLVALLDLQIVPVSSSVVRWLLAHGRARDAAVCLARPYVLEGTVVKGHQRGRTIGVPTANLACDAQLIPADGVYAGRCRVEGRDYPAALSIGRMPTFGENARQTEAHLIGFDGDLYGRVLRVEVLDWLREQRKLPGIEALKAQLAKDIGSAAERFDLQAGEPIASRAAGALTGGAPRAIEDRR